MAESSGAGAVRPTTFRKALPLLGLLILGIAAACAAPRSYLPLSHLREAKSTGDRSEAGSSISVSPSPLVLGRLIPGQSARSELVLSNRGISPMVVDHIETSCPCVRVVTPTPIYLGPRRAVALAVVFDPTGEDDFRGSLSVHLVGRSGDREAFRTRVEFTVGP